MRVSKEIKIVLFSYRWFDHLNLFKKKNYPLRVMTSGQTNSWPFAILGHCMNAEPWCSTNTWLLIAFSTIYASCCIFICCWKIFFILSVFCMNKTAFYCFFLYSLWAGKMNLLAQSADIVLTNGKIFTSDTNNLYVEALAIKGNKILATGSNEAIKKLASNKTKKIDLKGRTVVPGFNDAHAHVGANYPAYRFQLSEDPLAPTPWKMIKDSIAKIAKQIQPGSFIVTTIDPRLLDDTSVRKKALDSIAPHNPIMLSAWTGHGKILNTPALDFFGLSKRSSFEGGRIDTNNTGELTGLLEEYAEHWIGAQLSSKLDLSKIAAGLKLYYQQTAAFGITTTQNMCTQHYLQQAAAVYTSYEFPCRVRLITFPFTNSKGSLLHSLDNFFHPLTKMNYISGVKLILDGTPLERLACMRRAYKDKPGDYGRLNFNETEIKQYIQYCLAHKQQILIHAVGDSSIVTVIRCMRALHPDIFWKDKRLRIEHGEFAIISPEDITTLKQLGIVLVQNPAHLALAEEMAARFDNAITKYLQPLQTLINNNIPFALGSDGPINPFLNIMLTTIHPNNPNEALTVEEAVIAYTYGSAFAEFRENEKGTLSRNKLADLAVLSQDIFTIPKEQLPATKSLLTMVNGQIVYDQLD